MHKPTLRRMIGQMLIAGFPTASMPDDQAMRLIEEYEVGNFILFAHNIGPAAETARMVEALHRAVRERTGITPFVGADQEGGIVQRFHEGAFAFPGAMTLAAAIHAGEGSRTALQTLTTLGADVGRSLRACGVNVDLAPVLDVNIEPQNPVIGVRSYGDDPSTVAACGTAFAKGLLQSGVLPVFKHFPGHGNVAVDSHVGLPVNDSPRAALEAGEWRAFSEALAALGADAGVMTAHLVYRALEGEADVPATLSPRAVDGLLRDTFGFDGLVFTDCMEMGALRDICSVGEAFVRAVEAGCDLIGASHNYAPVAEGAEAILRAVESGRIPESRIEKSYARVMAAKARLGLEGEQAIDPAAASACARDVETQAFHARLAAQSVTLLAGTLDRSLAERGSAVRIYAPEAYARTGAEHSAPRVSLAALAAERLGWEPVVFARSGPLPDMTRPAPAANVLCLVDARLSETQTALLRALEAENAPLTILLLGAPYDRALVRRADATVLAAYEYSRLSANAILAAFKTGACPGKCPVRVGG